MLYRARIVLESCSYRNCNRPINRVPSSAGVRALGRNVISVGWQVTLCDPIWHVSTSIAVRHVANCCTPCTFTFAYSASYRPRSLPEGICGAADAQSPREASAGCCIARRTSGIVRLEDTIRAASRDTAETHATPSTGKVEVCSAYAAAGTASRRSTARTWTH